MAVRGGRRPAILVSDEDPEVFAAVVEVLGKSFEVIPLSLAAEPLGWVERVLPALVILDVRSGGDWAGLCRGMREGSTTRPIPVLLLHGLDSAPLELEQATRGEWPDAGLTRPVATCHLILRTLEILSTLVPGS